MNSTFEVNAVKPCDPGYVHDLQRDFAQPAAGNDWDATDDDNDE